MTTYERHDVVEVPFPFSDLPNAKKRKALVVSNARFHQQNDAVVLMMITSATHSKWYLDVDIEHLEPAGLSKPCVSRLKLFTLAQRLIIRHCGRLHPADSARVEQALRLCVVDATPVTDSG